MPEMRMNSLKSLAMNWGPLSEMIRGLTPGYRCLARSRNDLNVGLGHLLPQIPMNQETAVAVQDAACVRSVSVLTDRRFLHFQPRQDRLGSEVLSKPG